MNKITKKRILSLLMAVTVALTGILPATAAFAGDGVEGYYEIELFYKETNTIVPSYIDDTVPEEERQTYIEYMHEGDELELTYNLIDTEFPNNGYVKWYSETPTLVDVTQEGVVKAFDSSKGAVVQTWIDNEVKTIPLVGKIMATAIEKALFNEYVDIDTMDTEEIINIVEGLFGEGSILDEYVDSYKSDLIDSLRYYLDNINSNIHIQLYDANGTLLDDDFVQICVLKCEEWYANFLPNGTHITNKSQIPTTVAVGSTVQIYAVTTPLRLHYGCVYSVKSSSIFEQGKVVATVNDSGLVTFKNKGKVTIMVSPDTEQIVEGILKLVNYFYALENTGTLDTDKIAGILIDCVGIDMNRTVLAGILDVCFAIKDIAGDAADPVQLTATAVELIGNLVLQFVYNDTITFEVVDAQPLSDFSIEGPNSVKEGTQVQLEITDIQPTAGDTTDITWRSSDPSIASVDPQTGIVTGRDAGGSLGNLSNQKCTIYAVSAANQVERSFTITVTGKTGKYLSDVEIVGKSIVNMEEETNYSYTVYPSRVAESDNLYITWGMITDEDEEGNPIYSWASADSPVTDGIGTIDSRGHYTATDGGYCTIAIKAQTGYYLSNGDFYEISSYIRTFEVLNGIPVESIQISITDTASNGTLNKVNTVTINGRDYTYATIHKEVIEGYYGNGAVVSASIYPANATNQTLRWVVDNGYYKSEISDDTHTATVTQKSNHEVADTFNVYAVSEDGEIASNVITVCITRNYATTNSIDQESIELINGKQIDATHTIGFKGSWTGTAYACYKCNWYSSDEDVFTVETKTNDNRDARITAHDVGTATLYCVSADGGIVDTCEVTVYPDKEYLGNIIKLCDKTVIKRTSENRAMYNEYMRKLDLAYTIYYDEPLASQTVCDTYARELLYAFSRLGGFIGIAGVDILSSSNTNLDSNHITVKVGSTTSYTKYSYDFGYKILPASAMYSSITWTSSNSNIVVDKNGKCTPASNDPCTAKITCTVTDYLGAETSDSVYLTFARKPVTGVSLDTTNIVGGKIGETQTLKATVSPTGVSGASCTDVLWTTSNPEIAVVDENGVVSFLEGGDCVIYCTTYDGGFTAQCAVNVVTNYTPLSLLIQQYRDLSLNEANYFPDTWQVYIDAMTKAQAMIDKGGYSQNEVDAMYAELEAAYNGLKKYNYIQKIELYLDGEPTKEFYQYDLSLLSEGISYKNAVLDLNVRLYPNNGSYASVEWKSSTSDISVTSDGKCSPTINSSCYGMITCTVTDHFGNKFTDSVWVSYSYYPVTKLELSETNISGLIGETYQLACTVYPTGTSLTHIGAASIQDYFWESDNPQIASIDSSTGLVTFVSAGATVVRAVSYDGGVSAECVVSTEGDRSYLKQKLDEYKDVDHTQYAYDYGMTFVAAKQQAEAAMTDKTLSQEGIDSAAEALVTAYEQMILNPYIRAQGIDLSYTTYKRPLVGSSSQVASGTIGSNDALSVNLSSSYSNYNDYNDVKINAVSNPSDAMYKSIVWTVDDSKYMSSSLSGSAITLTPTSSARSSGAWAQLTVTITDDYDRTVSRTISVVMSDSICTGFDITDSTKSVYATDTNVQLAYTLSGSTDFTGIKWTSSDESVLTVDSSGIVTPIEKGTATVTGKTVDGGFTDSIVITVYTDFSTLASKQNEYYNLIQSVKDSFTYTEDSLEVLTQYVSEAQTMINEGKATQSEVNQMIENLDNAYNSLVPYIPAKGVSVGYNASSGGVTEPNSGYIRYTGSLLNGRYVKLQPNLEPAGSFYTTISWTSSNPNITVDENGVLTNNVSNAGVTEVTCTIQNIHGETYTASAYVSFVRYGVTSVSFADERVFGAPAQTVALSPTITNSNNSNVTSAIVCDCIYETSNPEIATVDENGVVTFITQGEAVITATALDGGYSATINAYTTWDTTALKAAIDAASAINYKDYAYEYGTAFNTAYQNAMTVYNNVYATQAEIDEACTALTEATTALEGHEFIAPVINLVQDTRVLGNTDAVEVDVETQTATVNLSLNEGAMVQSSVITVSEEVGVTTTVNGNAVEITKTEDTGSLKIAVAVTDDYGKTTTKVYSFSVINEIITATSIALTVDGTQLTSSTLVRSCGGTYTNFKGLTIGYVPTPADANAIKSVAYSSSASNYITIDSNGAVALTTAGKLASSNSTVITCTVTNTDGTTVTAQLNLTITRA
ncbi:MAG: Ig-like domain-containing protein [Eubacterium sp.]